MDIVLLVVHIVVAVMIMVVVVVVVIIIISSRTGGRTVETTGQGGRWLANEPDCRAFKSRSMILGWKVQLAFVGYWDSC